MRDLEFFEDRLRRCHLVHQRPREELQAAAGPNESLPERDQCSTASTITSGKDARIAIALERWEHTRIRNDFMNRVSGVLEDLRRGSQLVGQRPMLAIVLGNLGSLQRKTDGVVT
jgi:hypothetical protein